MDIAHLLPSTDNWYQDYRFQIFIESHLTYILKNNITNQREVTADVGAKYKGDFYGLLSSLAVQIDYHYIVLRLNGFTNSGDYDGSPISVILPSFSEMDMLKNVYRTQKP